MSWVPHLDNLPPGFREEDYYPELRRGRQRRKSTTRRPPPNLPLKKGEEQVQAEAFKRVDEWDRKRGGR